MYVKDVRGAGDGVENCFDPDSDFYDSGSRHGNDYSSVDVVHY